MRKSRRKPILEQPYTNQWGQTLNVGDEVIIITSCTGNVSVHFGKYLGVREDKYCWRGPHIGKDDPIEYNVCVEIQDHRKVLVHKETDVVFDYKTSPAPIHFAYGLNFYKLPIEEQNKKREEYNEKYNEWVLNRDATHYWKKIPFTRYSTLQLNRVLPLATSLKDLAEKVF